MAKLITTIAGSKDIEYKYRECPRHKNRVQKSLEVCYGSCRYYNNCAMVEEVYVNAGFEIEKKIKKKVKTRTKK